MFAEKKNVKKKLTEVDMKRKVGKRNREEEEDEEKKEEIIEEEKQRKTSFDWGKWGLKKKELDQSSPQLSQNLKRKKKKNIEIDINQPKVKEMIQKINEEEKKKKKDKNKKKEEEEEEKSQKNKKQEKKKNSEHNPDASDGLKILIENKDEIAKITKNEENPVGRHFEVQTSNSQKLNAGEKLKLRNI